MRIWRNQIAEETGVKVVDDLYLWSHSSMGRQLRYINMMKHNVIRAL